MNITASKTAINVIATYCNKHGITFEQSDSKTVTFEQSDSKTVTFVSKEITAPLCSYIRGVMQVDKTLGGL